MSRPPPRDLDALWGRHDAEWRAPAQVISQWQAASETAPELLRAVSRGAWWETLAACGLTLLVTREYEHLVMALRATERGPSVTYLRLPHPSGLLVDRARGRVYLASTRNPNQVYDLEPVDRLLPRRDVPAAGPADRPLVPTRSRFLPGCLYLHDLALIDGQLHANAVGQNAIVRLDEDGRYEQVWWPRCVESDVGPLLDRNYLQLNSIAAGPDLAGSYFSASTDAIGPRRPGHRTFAVDRRGVIFSGASRDPIVRGLTRPHSARLHDGHLWVDNSGYGELWRIEDGRAEVAARLPGWTRGLCFYDRVAFVGTSRVIPRFRQYAPGLDVERSVCGLHALDIDSGAVLGSLTWPYGNQIFAIDWAAPSLTSGFPFGAGRDRPRRTKTLFYAFQVDRCSE